MRNGQWEMGGELKMKNEKRGKRWSFTVLERINDDNIVKLQLHNKWIAIFLINANIEIFDVS